LVNLNRSTIEEQKINSYLPRQDAFGGIRDQKKLHFSETNPKGLLADFFNDQSREGKSTHNGGCNKIKPEIGNFKSNHFYD
jgi:hypothetical protein